MSKPFRGMSQPQMMNLNPNITLLEHSDPGAESSHMSTNAYAFLKDNQALLIDAGDSSLLPFIRQLNNQGFSPLVLVISHRHIVGQSGEALQSLTTEFQIPVLLHPIDAQHRQALSSNVQFENPIDHPMLKEFDLEALLFPGHTAGHTVLYSYNNGGLLFTGDAAMSTTVDQAEAGLERLIRPPIDFNVDDDKLREQWLNFNRPVSTVLPYHGTGYLDRSSSNMIELMRPLIRPEPTYDLFG